MAAEFDDVPPADDGPAWYLFALGGVVLVAVTAAASILLLRPPFPGDTSVDAGFARDMIVHHAQAVEMADSVRGRSDNLDVQLMARELPLVQQGQVGQMTGWLDVWGLPATGSESAMTWMGMPTEGPMPGMATRDELVELAGLEGSAADERFLQLMIAHHEGGVAMAEAAVAHEVTPPVRQLATVIAQAQRAEVETMRSLLAQIPGAEQPAGTDPGTMDMGGDTGHQGHG